MNNNLSLIIVAGSFVLSACNYTSQNHMKSKNVNIDFKQTGLGGDNSWGAWAWKKYQLLPLLYIFTNH